MPHEPESTLVVILAYHYPPSIQAGAVRPSHFAKYLQQFGYNVRVVTASRQDPEQPRPEVVFVPNRYEKPNRYRPTGLTEMVLRKFLFPLDDAMLWSRAAFHAVRDLVYGHRNMVVFSTFPPVNTHLAALRIKRRFPVKWIADFRDPMVGSPMRVRHNEQQPFGKLASAMDAYVERVTFANADALVANTDNVAERWAERYPKWQHKIHYIWNGFDSEAEDVAARCPPARPYRTLAHIGTIYHGRHPGPILAAIDRLISCGRLDPSGFHIRLVGPIDKTGIPNTAVVERLKRINVLEVPGTAVPQAEAKQAQREADYLLLLDITFTDAGQQVPSKLFEYIQIGKPVLALTAHNSPVERILHGSGIPHVCVYGDSTESEVDAALLALLQYPPKPITASDWFYNTFDAEPRACQLASIITVVTHGADRRRQC